MKGRLSMKKVISILLIATFAALCLFGCSNVPKEPPVTSVEKFSYVNPSGATVPVAENAKPGDPEQPVRYVETLNEVEFVFSSYHVYYNSVGAITDIEIEDDGFSQNVDAYADIRIDAIGSRSKDMRIGYKAYDKDGQVVRESHILALLDGVKKGDVCEERRFDFPRETVRIEFYDFVD